MIAAATLSFTFVLLHPFSDGNGRIHRWLIHWYLSRHGVTPPSHIIPVSAVMLSRRADYDAALESFSSPLMRLLDYELDEEGVLVVTEDSGDFYRHADLTQMVEALATWLDIAIDEEFSDELAFLLGLDIAREAVREIVDLPDRKAHALHPARAIQRRRALQPQARATLRHADGYGASGDGGRRHYSLPARLIQANQRPQ